MSDSALFSSISEVPISVDQFLINKNLVLVRCQLLSIIKIVQNL
jgi:hypothetical protein